MTGSRLRLGDLSHWSKMALLRTALIAVASSASWVRSLASSIARSRSGGVSIRVGVGVASVKCEYRPDSSMLAKNAERP